MGLPCILAEATWSRPRVSCGASRPNPSVTRGGPTPPECARRSRRAGDSLDGRRSPPRPDASATHTPGVAATPLPLPSPLPSPPPAAQSRSQSRSRSQSQSQHGHSTVTARSQSQSQHGAPTHSRRPGRACRPRPEGALTLSRPTVPVAAVNRLSYSWACASEELSRPSTSSCAALLERSRLCPLSL